MTMAKRLQSLPRLWRYYQAGIVNTAFGYGMYASFVALGLHMYVAQIVAHLTGMAFNYFTYSRHAFPDANVSGSRFVASYAVHYLLGLAALWGVSRLVASPYASGLIAVAIVSLINYFMLKHWVFTARAH